MGHPLGYRFEGGGLPLGKLGKLGKPVVSFLREAPEGCDGPKKLEPTAWRWRHNRTAPNAELDGAP